MSPEQLKTLQYLNQLFKDGLAGPEQIRELSELLSTINQYQAPSQAQDLELIDGIEKFN